MNWKNVVGKAAPMLGTILGGPHVGAAISLIAEKFGVEPTEESVARAIELDPSAGLKLAEIESAERAHVREMYTLTLRLELEDRQNAREVHDDSQMPSLITLVLFCLVVAYGACLFFVDIPEGNKDMVNYLGGQLIALLCGSVAYWVGTNRSNAFSGKVGQMPMGKGKGA